MVRLIGIRTTSMTEYSAGFAKSRVMDEEQILGQGRAFYLGILSVTDTEGRLVARLNPESGMWQDNKKNDYYRIKIT